MEGSAIRRIGHTQWLRNIFVAMGNAPFQQRIVESLESYRGQSELLDVHIEWALGKQLQQLPNANREQEGHNKVSTKKHRLIRIVEKGLPRDA